LLLVLDNEYFNEKEDSKNKEKHIQDSEKLGEGEGVICLVSFKLK